MWGLLWGAPAVKALDVLQTWEQARQHDPQMQVIKATRSSVQAFELQAKSLWRPVVMGSASLGILSAETNTQGAQFAIGSQAPTSGVYFGTSASAANSSRWSVNAKQALYSPERSAQQAQLQKAASAAELRADLLQQEFMLLTVQRYFNLLLAERQQQVLSQQHAAVTRSLIEAKDRFALGDLPITDTHEATARAANLNAQLLASDSDVHMARTQLAESTGMAPTTLQLFSPKTTMSMGALPELEQVLNQVRQANSGILLQKTQLEMANQELKKHQLGGAASLDLVASTGVDRWRGEGSFGASSNRQNQKILGISLNVPLYSGGYQSGKLQEAVSAAEKASAEFDLTVQQALQQARSVWLRLSTGRSRLSAMQAAWQASISRLDATRLGRQVGDRTTLELLQAENDASQAELAWLRAQTEWLASRLQLDALTGALSVQSLQNLNAQLHP